MNRRDAITGAAAAAAATLIPMTGMANDKTTEALNEIQKLEEAKLKIIAENPALTGFADPPRSKFNGGLLAFYIDVGQLPPFKAEAFVERIKDKFAEELKAKVPEEIALLFIPQRNSATQIQYIPFDNTSSNDPEALAKGWFRNEFQKMLREDMEYNMEHPQPKGAIRGADA